MIFFTFSFAFVFLIGSDANFGTCTFMELYCPVRECTTDFYKSLQKDPKGDCKAKLSKLIDCVIKELQICMGHQLSESRIKATAEQSYREDLQCASGPVLIPTMPPVGSICSDSYNSDLTSCIQPYRQKFVANKSDPSLCSELATAKKCLKKVIDSECKFPPGDPERLDVILGDYNPFCANNRDPGATGNDQCYGVKDINAPYSAASVIKTGVLQALLFAFISVLLFFKV